MAKYGGLTGPGSHGFPGWPSKVPGAPSGGGRYNAPRSSGLPDGAPLGAGTPANAAVPSSNFDDERRQIIPNGVFPITGSKYIRSLYYRCAGSREFEYHNLEVECIEEPHREYLNGNMPFELIFQVLASDSPGQAYDLIIHNNPELPYTPFYGQAGWFPAPAKQE